MLKSPFAIFTYSSLGYALANGITLYAYVIHKKEKNARSTNLDKKDTEGLNVPYLIYNFC